MARELKTRILIVDDESSIRKFLRPSLENEGFDVVEAETGKQALQLAIEKKPELIILDHGLPDLNGIEVLTNLREWSKVPILFLTVRDRDEDKVAALDCGADDYITKPFSVQELLARVRVALRHTQTSNNGPIFKSGNVAIDFAAHLITIKGKEVRFTATEYQLLALLAKHAGKILSHRTILKEIWGPNSVEHDHYLRVYFSQIRKKLESSQADEIIENESGVGYRLKLL